MKQKLRDGCELAVLGGAGGESGAVADGGANAGVAGDNGANAGAVGDSATNSSKRCTKSEASGEAAAAVADNVANAGDVAAIGNAANSSERCKKSDASGEVTDSTANVDAVGDSAANSSERCAKPEASGEATAATTDKPRQKRLMDSAPEIGLKIKLLAALLYCVLWLFYATCRIVRLQPLKMPERPSVVLFWHSRLVFMCFLYRLARAEGYSRTPYILSSPHKDGQLTSTLMKFFGIKAIYGSSNRGPVGALLAIRQVIESGGDVFITPDGPRGPAGSITPGVLAAAAKFGASVAVCSNSASRAWRFNTWDRLIWPKPFSRVCFAIKEAASADEADVRAAFSELENLQKEAGFYA